MLPVPHIGRRTLLAGASVLALPALATSHATAAGIDTRAQLTAALQRYLGGRVGTLGLHLYDRRDGSLYGYSAGLRLETLSTIKVLVLITLLRKHQAAGTTMTTTQQSLASRMICKSDNAATDALISQVGLAAMKQCAAEMSMSSTIVQAGSYGTSWWGYSMSTPIDLLRLVNYVVWGTHYLTSANRLYIQQLMAAVVAEQRWGVCDPPLPTSLSTLTKNGWGPRTGGYRLNSIGYVYGSGRAYSMAIMSRSPNGFTYGKETVNGVSRIVFDALDKPLT